MQIVLDITPAVRTGAGMGRYASELSRALSKLVVHEQLRLFSTDLLGRAPAPPLDRLPRTDYPQADRPWRLAVAWATWTGGAMDSIVGPGDLFHATDQLLPPLKRMASVFTLHDVAHILSPATQTTPNRLFSTMLLPAFLKRADVVITVSESTRRSALEYYDLPPEKVRTVLLGVPEGFGRAPAEEQARVRARYALPARYLLCVSTLEPRKNHALLFRALAALKDPEIRLVLVGRKGWKWAPIARVLRESGAAGQVQFCENVEDHDLTAIYSAAEVSLFPSLYEGFGMPPLESMACGTPVVCSNTSSMPEVVGDAAILLSPHDDAGWTQAIGTMWADAPRRAELAQRGLARAAELSYMATARTTLALYREIHDRRS